MLNFVVDEQLLEIIGVHLVKGPDDLLIVCLHNIFAKHFKVLSHDEFKRKIGVTTQLYSSRWYYELFSPTLSYLFDHRFVMNTTPDLFCLLNWLSSEESSKFCSSSSNPN